MTPVSPQDLASLKVGYATPCLGMHPSHTLEMKFQALRDAGLRFVELGFGNYVAWVRSRVDIPASTCPEEWKVDNEPDPFDTQIWDALYDHAQALRRLAKAYGLELLIMQPLNQFDGWPEGHPREQWVKNKAEKWLSLCSLLGVQYLQEARGYGTQRWIFQSDVGANDQAGQGAGDEKTAEDLKWLADRASKLPNPVKIAYEPWCFSPRVNDWEHCYEIVKLANHTNLGLCLDTAQMALAPSYGYDPQTGTGFTPEDRAGLISRLRALEPEIIFFLEISDVLKPHPPLYGGSDFDDWARGQPEGTPSRSHWVQCARSVPYIGKGCGEGVKGEGEEYRGGAHVQELADAVFSTGFRGPVIWEIFEALQMEKDDPSIPRRYAQASKQSKERLFSELART